MNIQYHKQREIEQPNFLGSRTFYSRPTSMKMTFEFDVGECSTLSNIEVTVPNWNDHYSEIIMDIGLQVARLSDNNAKNLLLLQKLNKIQDIPMFAVAYNHHMFTYESTSMCVTPKVSATKWTTLRDDLQESDTFAKLMKIIVKNKIININPPLKLKTI